MADGIALFEKEMHARNLRFSQKPVLIGGMAMEYYGLRKSGADIDLVVCDEDYQALARQYPDNRKDIWGDLGVVLDPFEIWRCIMLLDYDFYAKDAIDEKTVYVISMDKLLLTRVFAMDIPKYRDDLNLMKRHYLRAFANPDFEKVQTAHLELYRRTGGIVWGGQYDGEDSAEK